MVGHKLQYFLQIHPVYVLDPFNERAVRVVVKHVLELPGVFFWFFSPREKEHPLVEQKVRRKKLLNFEQGISS